MSRELKFETLAAHAGQDFEDIFGSRGVPIYRTTSYLFKNSKHAADLFDLKEMGYIYSRMGDPTTEVLEKRITAMEGGKASVAVSSGTNAIFYTIITICEAGDEIVSAFNVYGGTYSQFGAILPKFGINTKFVDAKDPNNFAKAITDKTKLIFIETISNPSLDFTDIEAVAKIAHDAGIPLVIDGTFTTPYLLQTIKHGADIVINSLTRHGLNIPKQVKIIGFDDLEMAAYLTPPLSTIHCSRYTLGTCAIQHMLSIIQNKNREAIQTIFQPEYKARSST